MKRDHQNPCPSPSPNLQPSSSSSLLKDISNFKTPKRPSQNPNNSHSPHLQFFTASKQTPSSSYYPSTVRRPSTVRSKAVTRLKAFELEQSQSSRKAQVKKENSLKSLSKSLTVWLNFLFENPESCGCDHSKLIREDHVGDSEKMVSGNGKRDNWPVGGVSVDKAWRSPKRHRDLMWSAGNVDDSEFQNSKFSALRGSLNEVCSFDDLKQRMRVYLSLGSCKEIFNVMTQVSKNIDEGRIQMKAHCPIVTDFGMKEKATKILMCYNPVWLRIGLYTIFGGESLLPTGDVSSDQESRFLKMVLEKQFFTHSGLAKAYAYNKKVEGLYRPGYFEALGNVILKRFLLLALVLDRAKSQSSLPLKHGIDGVDGGSPLLFTAQLNIKSSRHLISDFLSSNVMHGEGNLLAHLVILGYKVLYQQNPLIEYEFRVTDLFEDLQDGIRLCRAIQLLQHDSSILMKLAVPSDSHKKKLVNCGFAFQYLKDAGVPLDDGDGMRIDVEDVIAGDKELVLSLLWNMFVHLQLPLLVNKTLLSEEISRIRGIGEVIDDVRCSPLAILFNWNKAICEKYDFKFENFNSLVDGKAMWCLLDYYFRKDLHCSCSYKDPKKIGAKESVVSDADYTDTLHNFILSQKLMTVLGNFPEILQISDMLEHNGPCNERSVLIFMVFLSSALIVKKNMDQLNFHKLLGCTCQSPGRKHSSTVRMHASPEVAPHQEADANNEDATKNFKTIQAWWRDMAERNCKYDIKVAGSSLQRSLTSKHSITQMETAAIVIQSHFRQSMESKKYRRMKKVVSLLQTVIRAWLKGRWSSAANIGNPIRAKEVAHENAAIVIQAHFRQLLEYRKYRKIKNATIFLQTFIRAWLKERSKSSAVIVAPIRDKESSCERKEKSELLKRSVLLIQNTARAWISKRNQGGDMTSQDISSSFINTTIVFRNPETGDTARSRYGIVFREKESLTSKENDIEDDQRKAAEEIQRAWKRYYVCKSLQKQHLAATKIQSHFHGWISRRNFANKKWAIITIQRRYKKMIHMRALQYKRATKAAIIIQSHVRRWFTQRDACSLKLFIIFIQKYIRGWLMRKRFLLQREAAIVIQSSQRCKQCWNEFHRDKHAAIQIQRFLRGQIARRRLLGASRCHAATFNHGIFPSSTDSFLSNELKIIAGSILILQRWWRSILLLKSKIRSAVIIQSHVRGFIARREATKKRHRIIVFQAYCKGYLARKVSKSQLLDLLKRVRKSATNVDDSMRLINRHLVALSELLGIKSVSGVLHTCETLDMATKHSQKCCDKLVDVGAISTLLKLISLVSQSIPDQLVLRHALSTLRNLAHYPHLVELLIDSHKSVETIFWVLLRNKDEGYFIASDLLKKICSNQKGAKAVRSLPAQLKRLHSLVDDLTRKIHNEKRNGWVLPAKENSERRLREAVELLKLIAT